MHETWQDDGYGYDEMIIEDQGEIIPDMEFTNGDEEMENIIEDDEEMNVNKEKVGSIKHEHPLIF